MLIAVVANFFGESMVYFSDNYTLLHWSQMLHELIYIFFSFFRL